MSEVSRADIDEAKQILRIARERGAILRLFGGLAIHMHCRDMQFCSRPHADIDLIGLSTQTAVIREVMECVGYRQNSVTELSVGWERMLFEKPHSKDHIDVLLDRLTFEHSIDLRRRLEIEESTISVSDLLLSKLSIARLNEKDFRDIITILKDRPRADRDLAGSVNVDYIARLCSSDWGLFHDVLRSLDECLKQLDVYELEPDSHGLVLQALTAVRSAVVERKKSIRWRLRAMVGERIPWRRTLEEPGTWKQTDIASKEEIGIRPGRD